MDEHSCKENRTKIYKCARIHDQRKEVVRNSQETKILVCSRNQQSTEFLVEKVQRYMRFRCFNQWIEQHGEILEWLIQGRTVLLPKTEDLSNERNYRPITCLNSQQKMFMGMLGNQMKNNTERNTPEAEANWERALGFLELQTSS